MSHHDVVILGGGPAGTALALELKRHAPDLKILIAEAAIATDWRIGETLAPGAVQLLNGLGCRDHILRDGAIEGVRSQAAWGSDRPHAHDFMFSTRGSAWHLDRTSFDEALRAAAEAAGIEVWRGARFLSAVAEAAGWQLSLDCQGRRVEIGARFVADATGRSARFATSQGSRRRFADRLVGVAALVRLRDGAIRDHATLVEACENGWWYSTALPDGLMVLAWMSDSDIVHHHSSARLGPWLAQLRAAPLTAARAATANSAERIFTWPARSHCLDHVSGRNWVAVGDAASSWDPLSSAGIMKALRTGKLGAFVLLDAIRGVDGGGAKYRRLIEAEYRHYRRDRRTVYRMERRWSGSAFWQRRHAAEPFDREPAVHFAGEP
ncbi:tryptophan 7-halogenase [Bradyrhizobium sp. WYCCWR 13023]|uniref:Tryptophan 7-halogenase n=1 Tax=Bradyrhizobium zhengyangense TaxID=2911009 RepID=A0A9X1R8Z5_9BRAD|nr:tryptophan 7-halogenase [Bradyrhizobium zhengyangense]MCG2627192.1 tryptophan 7-halogenase [Bradyrhizobium zhengyangense]MCG2642150.1 tryptophan 7-halogenase [Bradyrhizobium zhengyangense]MCG2667939.1 tryptophan 7-halogenase [Bradyrhizobium zhengyangense]